MTLATGAISITTGDNALTFNHELDGGQALTVVSGTGNVTFTGAIGATTSLGGLTVNAAGDGDITFTSTIGDADTIGVVGITAVGNSTTADMDFGGAIYKFDGATTFTAVSGGSMDLAAAVSFTTAADNITFATANIELADDANLTVDTGAGAGNITIGGSILGVSNETVTLDAGTGTTSVGVIGNAAEIGALTIGSAENGGITLNGAILTDGDIIIDGPVTLATGAVSVTTTNDALTFNHSIDGAQALTLVSGTAATKVQGTIGGTTAISSLTVTNGTAAGTIELSNIEGVSGATGVGNTNTATITLDGTAYSTTGAQTYTAAAGQNLSLIHI